MTLRDRLLKALSIDPCSMRHDFVKGYWMEPEEGELWAEAGQEYKCTRCSEKRFVPEYSGKKKTKQILSH